MHKPLKAAYWQPVNTHSEEHVRIKQNLVGLMKHTVLILCSPLLERKKTQHLYTYANRTDVETMSESYFRINESPPHHNAFSVAGFYHREQPSASPVAFGERDLSKLSSASINSMRLIFVGRCPRACSIDFEKWLCRRFRIHSQRFKKSGGRWVIVELPLCCLLCVSYSWYVWWLFRYYRKR